MRKQPVRRRSAAPLKTVKAAVEQAAERAADSVKIEILRDGVCVAEGVQVDTGWIGEVAKHVADRLTELEFARRV